MKYLYDFRSGEPNFDLVRSLYKPLHIDFDLFKKAHRYIVDDMGCYELRHTMLDLFASKFSKIDNIMISYGVLHAIDSIFHYVEDKIDYCLVIEPCYRQPLLLFKKYNKNIIKIEHNSKGDFKVEKFEKYLKDGRALIYIIPNLNNPDGFCLSENNKFILSELYMKYKFFVIEDDIYADLYFDKESHEKKTIYDLVAPKDPEHRIFRLYSLSKILSPGIRLGFIESSSCSLNQLIDSKVDFSQSNLLSKITLELLSDYKVVKDCINTIKFGLKEKLGIISSAIVSHCDLKFSNPLGGYFLWCELPTGIHDEILLKYSRELNVDFSVGNTFFISPNKKYIRLCYAFIENSLIENGIKKLGLALENLKAKKRTTLEKFNI